MHWLKICLFLFLQATRYILAQENMVYIKRANLNYPLKTADFSEYHNNTKTFQKDSFSERKSDSNVESL